MQEYDNSNKSNKNNTVRRMPSGEGRPAQRPPKAQAPRSGSQSRPSGAPRSGGQPARRQAPPAGQPRSNNGTRSNGQSRPANPKRPDEEPIQSKPRRQAAAGAQPGKAGQPHSNNGTRTEKRPQNAAGHKTPKKPNNKAPHKAAKKKRGKIVLFVAEIFLLLILLTAWWVVDKTGNIQHVEMNLDKVYIDEGIKDEIEQGTSVMKGYRNIALFGVDSRDKQLDKNTRTDVIMIASINLDTKEVRLVSVYRDTWLNMTDDKYSKANAAYARGGAEQAIGMLNMNMDLNITDFVTVGFDAVIDTIDALGGVEIDVKEDEIDHLNSYQKSMVGRVVGTNAKGEEMYDAIEGVEYTPVTHAGLQTLNGLQATAYCRIRYTSGGDGARTERQRRVLTLMAQKAMTMGPETLNKIVDTVFGEVSTSLTMAEIMELLPDIANYKIGETAGFPFSDHVNMAGWVGKASVVVPIDLEKNVSLLHEFLFDKSDYAPTDTVKRCSQKIASDTGISYNGE